MLDKPNLADNKRKSFISIIQNSSNQLLSIVTDILTISSLETRQEKLDIQKVNINNILIELLSIFKSQVTSKNISLYVKKQLSDTQSEIYTDKTKVTQILTNLLTNASKFTHEGFIEFGYTLQKAPGLEIASEHEELQFYVKDTGIGIDAEQHEKIFERFRQADLSITRKYGGSGLGLSISKGFVELLGGKIWVQSEPRNGSTFYFTIPYKPVNGIDILNELPNKLDGQTTILVAEDEDYNYLFIEELLINMNVKLIHAKNGQEAVEICQTNPNISLVLMDIKMPILDGHKAALCVKEFRPDLPIIAQSAYALEHEIEKFNGGGFNDYVIKPIDEKELIQKVMKYLNVQVKS